MSLRGSLRKVPANCRTGVRGLNAFLSYQRGHRMPARWPVHALREDVTGSSALLPCR
jgi:hypothetical protein